MRVWCWQGGWWSAISDLQQEHSSAVASFFQCSKWEKDRLKRFWKIKIKEALRPDGRVKKIKKRVQGERCKEGIGVRQNCVRTILSTDERVPSLVHWLISHICHAEADLCATFVRDFPCKYVCVSARTALLCCYVCVLMCVMWRLDWSETFWAVCCCAKDTTRVCVREWKSGECLCRCVLSSSDNPHA